MPPRLDMALKTRANECVYALMRLNFDINRDFRRAALFRWMMPLPATRSNMLIASPTAVVAVSASPARIANSAFFTNVRAAVRNGRLRRRRRSATRMRFFAESLFAKVVHLINWSLNALSASRKIARLLATTGQWYQTSSPSTTPQQPRPAFILHP